MQLQKEFSGRFIYRHWPNPTMYICDMNCMSLIQLYCDMRDINKA